MRKLLLVLGAILLGSLPLTAWASQETQSFTANGDLCLKALPDLKVALTPKGIRVNASGEMLTGFIVSSPDWTALEGAGITVTITKETSVFDLATFTFSGHLTGRMTITTADGPLSGHLEGTVSGDFANPADILGSISASSAEVKWTIKGPDGKARGEGTATLTVGPIAGAFCGQVNLTGALKNH